MHFGKRFRQEAWSIGTIGRLLTLVLRYTSSETVTGSRGSLGIALRVLPCQLAYLEEVPVRVPEECPDLSTPINGFG